MASNIQEDEILNCPDCQLQALQQQQNLLPSNHEHLLSNSNQQLKDHMPQQYQPMPISNNRSYDIQNQVDGTNNLRPDTDDLSTGFQGKVHLSNNVTPVYKNPNGGLTSNQCNVLPGLQSPMTSVTLPLSSTSSSTNANTGDLLGNGNPCLTSIPIDGCDVSGYCATCAVLDLPTNEKFYRSSISGHSVFPPMFYRQAPPMPGFSPIPDCGPWSNCNSNDFGPYSYSAYPQQTSGDYYNACNVLPGTQSPSENVNQANTLNSCSFVFPTNNATVTDTNQCMKKSEPVQPSPAKGFVDESANDDGDSVIPICISSSSEDSSDSGSYISQREVIVEDVDDDDGDSVSISLCNIDRNQKCVICQNLIMTDCPSPLVNILENIHEDITAEDLDITVSSGDIEIGGIEDEVRDFHSKKSLPNGPQISFNRLSYLLNIPVAVFRTLFDLEESEDKIPESDSQPVPLCMKCGKLAGAIDSMEKQFRINCAALRQYFQHPQTRMSPLKSCNQMDGIRSLPILAEKKMFAYEREQNSFCPDSAEQCPQNFASCSFSRFVSKQTQTESFIECQKECHIVPFQSVSVPPNGFPSSKLTSTKDTMTEYTDVVNVSSVMTNNNSSHLAPPELSIRESPSDNPDSIIFSDLNLSYSHVSSVTVNINSGNQENFNSPESSMGTLNLGTDIQDFTCSFIPAINRDKDLPEIFASADGDSEDEFSSSISLDSLDDTLPSSNSKFLCEECGKILGCRKTFENHLKRHHNNFLQKCRTCYKGFANEATLAIHVRTHTGEKPFVCQQCSKSFSTKSNMISHEAICKLQSSIPTKVLSDSISNKTPQDKKLKCENCGICFRLPVRLERHKQKGCKAKVLECNHCGKKFSKVSEMKVHLLTHDGTKPYFCDVCGLSFSTKGNQIAHTRTHSMEKRFICEICDKGFHRKQALQLHYNRHNGTKPYGCNICERTFYDPSNLQNHKKTHEKKSSS